MSEYPNKIFMTEAVVYWGGFAAWKALLGAGFDQKLRAVAKRKLPERPKITYISTIYDVTRTLSIDSKCSSVR